MRQLVFVLWTILAAGCGQQGVTKRTYREVMIESPPPIPAPGMAAESPSPFAPADVISKPSSVPASPMRWTWETPEGWERLATSSSSLVTFLVDGAKCTLTEFPGEVGGLQANIERWLGQLNVPVDASQDLRAFINSARRVTGAGGHQGRIYDFSPWLNADPGAVSMLVAIFEKSDSTVFVKLMGPGSVLGSQRENFLKLCRSLQ